MTTTMRSAFTALFIATALLLAPSVAHAGFAFTKPTANAYLNPGAPLSIAFTASCPEGKACGTFQTYNVYNDIVEISLRNEAKPGEIKAGPFSDPWVQVAFTAGATKLNVHESIPAGRWQLHVKWAECPKTENPHDRLTEADCAITEVTRSVQARAMVGSKSTRPYPQVSVDRKRASRVHTNLWFMCNAPVTTYRVAHVVQRRVRKGKRMVWANFTRPAKNLRVQRDPESNTQRCVFRRQFTLSPALKAKDTIRVKYVVSTPGLAQAAKPRTIYSAQYTRRTLPGTGGGGVVIGS